MLSGNALAGTSAKKATQSELEKLANWMCGNYNSAKQATKDTNYLNISLIMVRIWPERTDGVWLYVEQAATAQLDRPYRQRVYHLEQLDLQQFQSTIYALPDPKAYIGAQDRPEAFQQLRPKDLEVLPGCAISLTKKGKKYIGSTEKGACINSWGKAQYATSEVEIKAGQLMSWDRGWNAAHEQVWGAENGGYIFVKSESCTP